LLGLGLGLGLGLSVGSSPVSTDLVVSALGVGGVGRLVGDEHVVEVQPGEGGDGPRVVRQVGEEALGGRLGDVEHQPLLGRLVVLGAQRGGGQRREDELVHLQDEGGHERGSGGLVGHGARDTHRQPGLLRLHDTQGGKRRGLEDFALYPFGNAKI